ncbi:hypothetical protein M2103_001630 [Ereboglobus sp. PH5-5]|uniref:hypothetical protein n=1 Tax=Ereboglobus sp. PH5-5 TaxID=2940529 RepID=UPI002406150C|nr:hypothetical protein [Ereboglobus sp. PH5-5]MDF9833406.1 hypothetical protein [Ereboglobus sp. PH5-5]
MRPRKQFPSNAAVELKLLLSKAASRPEYSRIQAVLIRAVAPELKASQIADITGLSATHVAKLHSQFLRHGAAVFTNRPGRGGHRHGIETEKGRARKEQQAKLAAKRAKYAQYLSEGKTSLFARMKIALEEKLGRPVSDVFVLQKLREAGFVKNK